MYCLYPLIKKKQRACYLTKEKIICPLPISKEKRQFPGVFFFFYSTYYEVLTVSSPGRILKDGYSSESNHDVLCSINPTIESIDLAPHFLCPRSMNICMKAPLSDKNKYIQSLP